MQFICEVFQDATKYKSADAFEQYLPLHVKWSSTEIFSVKDATTFGKMLPKYQ